MKIVIETKDNPTRCGNQDPVTYHSRSTFETWRFRLNKIRSVPVLCIGVRKPGGKGPLPLINVFTELEQDEIIYFLETALKAVKGERYP